MPPELQSIGRLLIVLGVVIVLVGAAFLLLGRVPGLGRLPGDIVIQREGMSCFIPVATSIVLSLLLTVVLNLVLRFINRQ